MTPRKTVFLVESGDDAETAIIRGKEIGETLLFIALRPEASYAFERRQVPFRTRNDYFSSEIANTIGMDNDKKIENISSFIDEEIQKGYRNFHLKPANDCFVSLKILFDVVMIDAAVIHRIIETEKPTAIHVFSKPVDPSREQHLPYSANESVYAEILLNSDWGSQVIGENMAQIEMPGEAKTPPVGPVYHKKEGEKNASPL